MSGDFSFREQSFQNHQQFLYSLKLQRIQGIINKVAPMGDAWYMVDFLLFCCSVGMRNGMCGSVLGGEK